MSKVDVRLVSAGIRSVLNSDGVRRDLEGRAARVKAAANGRCSPDGPGTEPFACECKAVGDRYRAIVRPNSAHGANAARKGYLSDALKAAR